MRSIILFLMICSIEQAAAQAPTNTKMPSKKEMQGQMSEMMNGLNQQIADLEKQIIEAKRNKEDPESIKQMEDQLAMMKKQVQTMGGLSKSVSKISDKTYQQAIDRENAKGVPERDNERINALPKKILTDAELVVFIQKAHTAIEKKLPTSQKKNAKELYDEINLKSKSPDATGNVAIQCWMVGSNDMALWILGKACMDDMTNTDILSNYGSLLSMVGGEHLAIPILQNLEKKFPNNTTILNNLGQAWYGLGDMPNSKKYLEQTMHAYSLHSQANLTNAKICMSHGNNQEAIQCIKKSIEKNYTGEKEALLHEAGGELEYSDIPFPYPGPAELLGYERFIQTIPDYPMDAGPGVELQRMIWEDWRRKIREASEKINEEIELLARRVQEHQKKVVANSALLLPYNNKIHNTALTKLTLLIGWGSYRIAELGKKMYAAEQTIGQWREDCTKKLHETEGCAAKLSIARNFNTNANELWHERNNEYLDFLKQYLGEQARLCLYAWTDRSEYELNMATVKAQLLGFLGEMRCEFEVGCSKTDPPQNVHSGELPDFDEMNCQYRTELSVPYLQRFFSIKVDCNKMTTQFDLIYVKGSLEENLANGKYHGTVEIRGKIGSDKEQFGPIEIGTQVQAGAGVEFTEGGIEDVYVVGQVGVNAGVLNLGSLEGRMSVVTGNGSITGKGALSGISIK